MKYYSTFVPGLGTPVKEALQATIRDVKILVESDGLIAYESNATADVIQNLPFVTNSFCIIRSFCPADVSTITNMATEILADRRMPVKIPVRYSPRNTFRIITSVANQLVPIDSALMQKLEQRITSKTRLRPHRAKPDFEFWLLQRSEGHGFFSFRLSHHKAYDKILQKGELRPELANILCRLSEPRADELFLDPFCGSGAIPIQRARSFAKGLVIASDIDEQKVTSLRAKVKSLHLTKRMVVRRDDALNLTRYRQESIHKIVTDPPWGHFTQLPGPITDFYSRILTEFGRVLHPKGKIVIVTGETLAFDNCLDPRPEFTVEKKFNILLSGKKASVYVLAMPF